MLIMRRNQPKLSSFFAKKYSRTDRLRRFMPFEPLEERHLLAVVNWINPAGGDWSVASNWQDDVGVNRLPGPGDDAVINVAGGATVTHSATATDQIQSLTASSPIRLSAGVLDIATTLTSTSTFIVAGGTLRNATTTAGTSITTSSFAPNSTLDGVTVGGGSSLVLSSTDGFFNDLKVINDLVVDGQVTLGFLGRLLVTGTQTIEGTGELFLSDDTASLYLNQSDMTLTFGTDLVVRGGLAPIQNNPNFPAVTNTTLINHGTIRSNTNNANSGGFPIAANMFINAEEGRLEITAAGSALHVNSSTWQNQGLVEVTTGRFTINATNWTNTGEIILSSGTLNLGGNFNRATLGTLTRAGGTAGTINLTGTLNNSNDTLLLTTGTDGWGTWVMAGGRIVGGTIETRNGAQLLSTSNLSSTLDGVTLSKGSDLVLSSLDGNPSRVNVINGMTVDGTVSIGSIGRLLPTGTQTLDGHGEIVFTDSTAELLLNQSNMTLTLGPSLRVHGREGNIGNWLNFPTATNTTIVNQGTVQDDYLGINGGITIGGPFGNFTNGPHWINTGSLRSRPSVTLRVQSAIDVDGTGLLDTAVGGTLVLHKGLTGTTTNADQFRPRGRVQIDGTFSGGTPRLLEAMSEDRGNNASGYERNFAYGALELTNGATVLLVNNSDNALGAGPEAVYSQSLLVPAGSTLDLNGLHLYTRAAQINGTVVGGTVSIVPDGGAIMLGRPTPGAVSAAGQVDSWTFFGRAGQSVRAVVSSGAISSMPPFTPEINNVQVQVVHPDGSTVLATTTNSQAGGDATLASVNLPVDGVYTIRIQAAPSQPASTGNYVVTVWDASVRTLPLVLNQSMHGQLASIHAVDQWTFAAAASQQVQFERMGGDPGLVFDLTGPGGFVVFTGLSTSSSLVTLTTSGIYTLKARSTQGADGGYAFRMNQTSETPLALGTTYNGVVAGSGFAQLFRLDVPSFQPLLMQFDGQTSTDRIEVYANHGSPPTRQNFDFKNEAVGADHQVSVPYAVPGTWYVLVYGDRVPSASNFTLRVDALDVRVLRVFPQTLPTENNVALTINGLGFQPDMQVEIIPQAAGVPLQAFSVSVDSTEQSTAYFDLSTALGGLYDIRVTLPNGLTSTLAERLTISAGSPDLKVELLLPEKVGRHAPAVFYVEYENRGTVSMAAPILILKSDDANNSDRPQLSLDKSAVVAGHWTSAAPVAYSYAVQIYAQGKKTPGLLEPGERNRVQVNYAGLEQPYDFTDAQLEFVVLVHEGQNSTAIDWPSHEAELRPDGMTPDAWSAVFDNLQTQIGPTWGDYHQMITRNQNYLQRLGQAVVDVQRLYGFEVAQANGIGPVDTLALSVDALVPTPGLPLGLSRSFGNTITQRYHLGPFGRGWNAAWEQRLELKSDGTVILHASVDSERIFQPDSRSTGTYFSQAGDTGILRGIAAGQFELSEPNGVVTRFLANGRLDQTRDANGTSITAGYAGTQLTSLTHSSGASIALSYNAAGRVASVIDSLGRTVTYTYDIGNEHLLSVADSSGTTSYAYSTGNGAGREHALTSVTDATGVTEYFEYNTFGRLSATYVSGNLQRTTFDYGTEGQVFVTDSEGVTTQINFDGHGMVARASDATGYYVRSSFDDNHRLVQSADATGRRQSNTWDAGSLLTLTDALRHTTQVIPGGPLNQPQAVTDALGNVMRYAYDATGNRIATTYPDATVERATYDAAGNPDVLTNRRGQFVDRTVNAAGQVTHETRSDGSFADYTYDARGRLSTATDASGTTTLTYDTSDRLTRVEYPNGRWLEYTYDAAGRRTRIEDHTGFATNYEYDAAGRLHRLRDASNLLIVEYTYDAAGRLAREDKGNGTYSLYDYDSVGRTTSIIHYAPDGSINSQFLYAYDFAGRRISQQTVDGTWTYTYDLTDQLTQAVFVSINPTIPHQDLQYEYDALGNRTRTILNGTTTDYTTNSMNQYTSAGSTTYRYDLDGNLVEENGPAGLKSYTYDFLNRLVRMETPQGVWQYQYDALGNRTSVIANGQVSEFLVDPIGLGHVLSEYDGTGMRIASYDYGLGLVARGSEGSAAFYDFDGSGSTSGITVGAGSYVNRYSYDPFGKNLLSTETISNRFGFNGQYGISSDSDDTRFMRARVYSTEIGRFLSQDPIRLQGGSFNLYGFVNNDPINAVDPSGLFKFDVGGFHVNVDVDVDWKTADREFRQLMKLQRQIVGLGIVDALSGEGCGNHARSLLMGAGQMMSGAMYLTTGPLFHAGGFGYTAVLGGETIAVGNPYITAFGIGAAAGGMMILTESAVCDVSRRLQNSLIPPAQMAFRAAAKAAGVIDPNEKLGAAGFGPQSFVAHDTTIPYRINFENLGPGTIPTPAHPATEPVQRVEVTDQLSSDLDWDTFEFTGFGFGDTNVSVEDAGAYHFQTVLTNFNGTDFRVEVEISFDSTTGTVRVVYQALELNSELPPNALIGFLPPEDGTGRGKGYLTFSIRPKAGLPSGTELRNVAIIKFDVNDVIATNQIDPQDPSAGTSPDKEALNTIDAGLPTSSVSALPATINTSDFTVQWSGTDDANGSGIGGYDIYVSIDAGPYALWQDDTTATTAVYSGSFGHSYAFYSVATDNVGHVEPAPGTADATTTLQQFSSTNVMIESDHPAGSIYGQSVLFTATVSTVPPGGTPTGTVQLQVDGFDLGSAITLNDGVASISTSVLTAGSHAITAIYVSDSGLFEDSIGGPLSQQVDPAPLSVMADHQTKVYGSADPTLTYVANGFQLSDTAGTVLTGELTRAPGESVAGSPYAISQGTLAANSNYTIGFTGHDLVITPAPLMVTADHKTKVYGSADPPLPYVASGFQFSDTAGTVLTGELTRAPGESVAGSPYAINQGTLAANSNYTINFTGHDLEITPAPLTVTADHKSKVYGSADPPLTYVASGFQFSDTAGTVLTGELTRAPGESVAGSPYAISQGTLAANSNYTISFTGHDLVITPAPLTVTADHNSKVYGSADPPLTYVASGFQFSDTAGAVLTGGLTRAPGESVAGSPYAISQGTLAANSNYTISFTGHDLVITPAPLSVSADHKTKVYGSADPPLTYVASGFQFSDTAGTVLTGELTRAPGESVAGSPYAISQGTLAANSNYTISFTGHDLVITPAPLTITADDKSKVYGAPLPTLTASYSGLVNGDTPASLATPPTLTTTATAASHVVGSPYPISVGGASSSNYTISYASGSLTVTPAPLTITADNKTKVVGEPLPPLTASYSGFVNGDTPASLTTPPMLSTTATATSGVEGSPYPITVTGAASPDYTISFVNGLLFVVAGGNANPVITTLIVPGWSNPGREGISIALSGSFTDADLADTHTATVNWGDGSSVQELTISETGGAGTFSHTHVYANGGLYQVTVTLSDSNGGSSTAMADAVITGSGLGPDGTLRIIGSTAGDGVLVYRLGTNQIAVSASFQSTLIKTFHLPDVDRIIADLGNGNDVMAIANQVSVPAIVRGGGGSDVLTSGGGIGALLGGDGIDYLYGGSGRSVMIGGGGRDILAGGAADDVLLGGSSNLDDDNNTLFDVLDAWRSTASYSSRVAVVDLLLDDVDDLELDRLTGGLGRDLFFNGLGDVLTDRKSSGSNIETVL
jgi:RHS repeat-associated protein